MALFQARSTAVGGGPAMGGCKILHSGHFWHCFTMVVVVGRKSGPAKAGPAGAAATRLSLLTDYKCSSNDPL